jgi:hypothetical protein
MAHGEDCDEYDGCGVRAPPHSEPDDDQMNPPTNTTHDSIDWATLVCAYSTVM